MQRMKLSDHNGTFQVISVAPRVDREGVHRSDREGRPTYELECLHRPPEEGAAAEVVKIKISQEGGPPSIPPMTEVRFEDFEGFFWQMGDRAGVSLSCAAVEPVGAAKAQSPETPKGRE